MQSKGEENMVKGFYIYFFKKKNAVFDAKFSPVNHVIWTVCC